MVEYVLFKGDMAVVTLRKPEAPNDLKAKHPSTKLLIFKVDAMNLQDITDASLITNEIFGRIDLVFDIDIILWVQSRVLLRWSLAQCSKSTSCTQIVSHGKLSKFFRVVNMPAAGEIAYQFAYGGTERSAWAGHYNDSKFGE